MAKRKVLIIAAVLLLVILTTLIFNKYPGDSKDRNQIYNPVVTSFLSPTPLLELEPLAVKSKSIKTAVSNKRFRIIGITSDVFRHFGNDDPLVDELKEKVLSIKPRGVNTIILYLNYPDKLKVHYDKIVEFVDWAGENQLYVLINPVVHQQDPAISRQFGIGDSSIDNFYKEISLRLSNYHNVLYGLGAEPNTSDYEVWREKQIQIIKLIRDNSPNSVVVVNGLNFGRDLSYYENNPIELPNVIYSIHVYPAESKKDTRLSKGCSIPYDDTFDLPFFVEEFGGVWSKDFGSKEDLNCIEKIAKAIKNYDLGFGMHIIDTVKGSYAGISIMNGNKIITPRGEAFLKALER